MRFSLFCCRRKKTELVVTPHKLELEDRMLLERRILLHLFSTQGLKPCTVLEQMCIDNHVIYYFQRGDLNKAEKNYQKLFSKPVDDFRAQLDYAKILVGLAEKYRDLSDYLMHGALDHPLSKQEILVLQNEIILAYQEGREAEAIKNYYDLFGLAAISFKDLLYLFPQHLPMRLRSGF